MSTPPARFHVNREAWVSRLTELTDKQQRLKTASQTAKYQLQRAQVRFSEADSMLSHQGTGTARDLILEGIKHLQTALDNLPEDGVTAARPEF